MNDGGWTRMVHEVVPGRAAALVLVLTAGGAACSTTRDAANPILDTNVDGVLTVAADLPAPGFWDGDTPDDLTGGFELALAEALADQLDLDLRVVDARFSDILDGELDGADLALSQVEIAGDHTDRVDLSIPYLDADYGVVVLHGGHDVDDLATDRDLSWAVPRATGADDLVGDVIDPAGRIVRVVDDVRAIDAVAAGKVDAALVDLSTALVLAGDRADIDVVARVDSGSGYGAVLPANRTDDLVLVDAALRTLASDGTLDDLEDRELDALYGTDPDDLPIIRHRR